MKADITLRTEKGIPQITQEAFEELINQLYESGKGGEEMPYKFTFEEAYPSWHKIQEGSWVLDR